MCFFVLLTLAVRPFGSRTRHRVWLWLLFAYYLWVLSNTLFFDAALGRGSGMGGVNLEPLDTIRKLICAPMNWKYPRRSGGHEPRRKPGGVCAHGSILLALFRGQRNLLLFLATMILLVAGVEMVQYLTHTGSCDIDDLILNTAGALAVWLVLLPWRLWTAYKEGHR